MGIFPESERMRAAIRAGCLAGDIHLTCSYPECKCKQTPKVAVGAVVAWRDFKEANEKRPADIVERLRWSISADTPARYPDIVNDAISEIERLRTALKEISQPLMTMQDRAKAEGCILNGETALNIISNPEHYRQIARRALAG